jgi:hypothetical protein
MSLLCAQIFPDKPKEDTTTSGTQTQRAAFLTSLLWPVGYTLRIYFYPEKITNWYPVPNIDPKFLDPLYGEIQGKVDCVTLVKKVVTDRLAPMLNMKFEFTDNIMNSDIRIQFAANQGCHSLVGDIRNATEYMGKPTMVYSWLDVSTVIHEFGHVLGMIHEHQNPSGNPIRWNKQAVYCYYGSTNGWSNEEVDNNVLDAYNKDQVNGSDFDPASIMIYPFPKSIVCQGKEMFVTLDQSEINPNYRLSNSDVAWLKIMYPKDGIRDLNLIGQLPGDVIPTEVYKPITEILDSVGLFLKENGKTTGYVLLSILLAWGGYSIYSWRKKIKSQK